MISLANKADKMELNCPRDAPIYSYLQSVFKAVANQHKKLSEELKTDVLATCKMKHKQEVDTFRIKDSNIKQM